MSESAPYVTSFFWRLVAFVLIVTGGVVSAYLLARHFALTDGGFELFDICRAVFGGDCDAAIRSQWAVQLGIPLAGWGLVHFVVVAVALVLALSLGDTFRTEGTVAALALCMVATVLGAVLTGMMLTTAAAFCPLCIIVHAVNLLLIPVILLATGRTMRDLRSSLGSGFKYLAGGDADDPILVRWKVTGLVTAALAGIVIYQWVVIESDRRADKRSPATFEEVLAEFEAGQAYEVPLDDEDPRLGDISAQLQLVLFSDFQCPACRRFAQALAHIREDHPEIAVVFKHYPLGKQCNAGVKSDLHPLSCAAAYAAEAARRQGKFWEYHDALFASAQEIEVHVLRRLAQEVGLDMTQFEADLADTATKAKVESDVALGKKLNVPGTPTVFLNNKLVSRGGLSQLDQLIEHESVHSQD